MGVASAEPVEFSTFTFGGAPRSAVAHCLSHAEVGFGGGTVDIGLPRLRSSNSSDQEEDNVEDAIKAFHSQSHFIADTDFVSSLDGVAVDFDVS